MQRRSGPWFALAAMAGANIMVTLDFFGLNTALPTIGRDLGGNTATLQWIANIYLLFMAAPLMAAGRLGDLLGRRKICVVGLACLAVGSVVAALAPSATVLIAARAASGLAASLVAATSLAIVDGAFPRARRGYALGVYSAIGAVGTAVGPLIGGFVTQVFSWRWFFGLAVPVIAVVIAVTFAWTDESRDTTHGRRIDWVGTALLTAGLFAVVFGLVRGPELGFGDPRVVATLAGGALLLVAFAIAERRMKEPLVRFSLFETRQFTVTNAVAFVGNFAFGVAMFQLTLYLQQVRDLSPISTGVVFFAFTIPLAALGPVVGRAIGRVPVGVLMGLGAAALAASFVCFGAITLDSGLGLAVIGLFLSGAGQAGVFDVSNFAALDAVPDDSMGAASGVVNGIRQIGTLVGLAVVGAVFNGVQQAQLRSGAPADAAFVTALRPAMLLVAALCAITAVATPLLLRRSAVTAQDASAKAALAE